MNLTLHDILSVAVTEARKVAATHAVTLQGPQAHKLVGKIQGTSLELLVGQDALTGEFVLYGLPTLSAQLGGMRLPHLLRTDPDDILSIRDGAFVDFSPSRGMTHIMQFFLRTSNMDAGIPVILPTPESETP